MIYVFRSKASTGARVLAEALDGKRIRQVENLNRLVRPGDTVVCWGEAWARPGVTVLNGGPFRSKLQDAITQVEADLDQARAAGDQKRIAALEDDLASRRAFLETAQRASADFS